MSSKSTFSNYTAKSYALAFYEISKDEAVLEKVENEMNNFRTILNESHDFKKVILSPMITKEDKKKVLFKIAEQSNFSSNFKKFLGFVTSKNRLFFIEKIIENFLNIASSNKGELKAKLISSKELTTGEQKKIQDELSKEFKSSLNIDYKFDSSLIAGLIIQIGSIMVDTSVKNKLKKMQIKMVEA